MDHWQLEGFRRRLEAGEPLDLDEQRTLLESLVELDRTVRLPAEFHIRVHREGDGTRWSAQHPLLRLQAAAQHPSDALVRAAVELRRVLQVEFHWPGEAVEPGEHDVGDVPESTWETLSRTDPAPETVVALAGALRALEEVRSETHALRYGQSRHALAHDPDATPAQRSAARTELRRRHAEALATEGVEAADEEWRDDGFGPAEQFGILLPTLVVGVVETRHQWTDNIPSSGRHWPWTEPRLFPAGRWVALEHSWHNDDHWAGDPQHLRLIAQPLQATPAAELALRRLADTVRSGESVGVHAAYHEAASRLLPEVSVRNVQGWISPAALPLDMSSLDHLVADPPDLTGGDVWATHFKLFWLSDPSATDR